jgi:hypothetical protein
MIYGTIKPEPKVPPSTRAVRRVSLKSPLNPHHADAARNYVFRPAR